MIRFCDKIIYNIIEGEMSRSEILTFFLSEKERLSDVIAIYSEEGEFIGTITYGSVLRGENIAFCINTAVIHVTENFWEEAHNYFETNREDLLTVVDKNGSIMGFAYDDGINYLAIKRSLDSMEECGIPALSTSKYRNVRMMVITDLNELAWRVKEIFSKYGYQVCVLGEKWEWFGYKSGDGYLDCAEFEKMYLYAEGTDFMREAKRLSAVRYNDVKASFVGIRNIMIESTQIIYKNEINKLLQKGVTVCECIIPDENTLKYKTELEQKSINLDVSFDLYIYNEKCVSDIEKDCIEEVYGAATVKKAREQNTTSLLQKEKEVCVGKIIGRTLAKMLVGQKRIYLLGPCIVDGTGCSAEDSLVGIIQQMVEAEGYQVIGLTIAIGNYIDWQRAIEKIPLRKGDIVLIVNQQYWFPEKRKNCKRIDLSYVYDNPKRNTMFAGIPIHSNAEGNRVLAKEIYESYLKDEMARWKDCKREFLQKGEILSEELIAEISGYTDSIKCAGDGTVGSIVMNCNPFTYGHRYLIEYAAKKVDSLYIFVVEEDRSFFKFKDRMQMVKQGTRDLDNVVVVPSGRWVLSYDTMPIYFEKATKQEVQVDASKDLEIFARYIAPPLGITKRFVGEEPTDKVTRQYNQQMQELLGDFDIELEIIPRKELDGVAISASNVRRYMKEGNWEAVKRLVPKTTLDAGRVIMEFMETGIV